MRTMDFVEVLISMAEMNDADAMQQELSKLMEPYRGVSLPRGGEEEMNEEQADRLSRVLRRARAENSFD